MRGGAVVKVGARFSLADGLETEAWLNTSPRHGSSGSRGLRSRMEGVTAENWVVGECKIFEATNEGNGALTEASHSV